MKRPQPPIKTYWFDVGDWTWGVVVTHENGDPTRPIYRLVIANRSRRRVMNVYARRNGKKLGDMNQKLVDCIRRVEVAYLHSWVREVARNPVEYPPPPLLTTTVKIAKALGLRGKGRPPGSGVKK